MRDYTIAALIGACLGMFVLWFLSGFYVTKAPTPEFEGMDSDDVYFHFRMNDVSREIRNLPADCDQLCNLYLQAISLQRAQVFVDLGCTYFFYGAVGAMGLLWIHRYRKRAQASETGEW